MAEGLRLGRGLSISRGDIIRRITLTVSAILVFTRVGYADDARAAAQKALDAFCSLNLRYIETIFDATRTTCRIVTYRQGLIIVFTAEKPVFRVPAARKAWAIVAVSAAGKTIRDMGGSLFGIDYVGLTDSEQEQLGKAARLPASFAEELQAGLYNGTEDANAAVERLDKRLHLEQ